MREIPARTSHFLNSPDDRHISDLEQFTAVERDLNERSRRLLVAAEARNSRMRRGITARVPRDEVRCAAQLGAGLKDLATPGSLSGEVRRPGGGCPTVIANDPTLLENMRQTLVSNWMCDPMRPLMWVSKSHL